ncbi:MAG: cupin domain-containing protein [Planctomycetes bacterium]|nr:cupin domain-containing protein [Planctomycetota bacterium]
MERDPNQGYALTPDELDWQPMSPGVEVARLHRNSLRDFGMMLLRMAPGAGAPRHVHPEGEQYYVISGTIVDETGRHGPGSFVHHPPGSIHEPSSPEGALVLVTWFGRLRVYED